MNKRIHRTAFMPPVLERYRVCFEHLWDVKYTLFGTYVISDRLYIGIILWLCIIVPPMQASLSAKCCDRNQYQNTNGVSKTYQKVDISNGRSFYPEPIYSRLLIVMICSAVLKTSFEYFPYPINTKTRNISSYFGYVRPSHQWSYLWSPK